MTISVNEKGFTVLHEDPQAAVEYVLCHLSVMPLMTSALARTTIQQPIDVS